MVELKNRYFRIFDMDLLKCLKGLDRRLKMRIRANMAIYIETGLGQVDDR